MNLSTIGVIFTATWMTAAEIWVFLEIRKRARKDPEYQKKITQAMKRHGTFFIRAVVLGFALYGSLASAQTWVETRTYTTAGVTTPRLDAWLSRTVAGKVGSFAWFQADRHYAQAYIGASVSPRPWLQFGAGGGLEQDPRSGRFGSFLWAGNKRQSAIAIFETGGSGAWWKAEYNRQIKTQVGIGFITERYKGTGLRVQVSVPKTPLTIWGAGLIKEGHPAAITGVRVKM